MIRAAVLLMLAATPAVAGDRDPANVNSRYTVESIEIVPPGKHKVSDELREAINRLVGARFDHEALSAIGRRIRRELHARMVTMKVTRGTKPEHVQVSFEPSFGRGKSGDVVVPRLIYHSKNNFTYGVDARFASGPNAVSFGVLTDNDELVERYSGIRAGFERGGIAGDRLAFRFDLESWRAQWTRATQLALDDAPEVPGIYRTRFQFRPAVVVTPVAGLTLTAGMSLQRFETQFPTARTEASTAAIASLRLDRRWELSPGRFHRVDAGYGVRSATRSLDSDFVYTRHSVDAAYSFRSRRESVTASLLAGSIHGRAPLFERFVLGNSRTLRGWNRFDVAPLGGDRVVHGSLDYRWRWFRAVYDAGSVWDHGLKAKLRQSIGAGLGHDGAWLLVAFPIREGRAEPMVVAGINF
jgi:hypothetical protein